MCMLGIYRLLGSALIDKIEYHVFRLGLLGQSKEAPKCYYIFSLDEVSTSVLSTWPNSEQLLRVV